MSRITAKNFLRKVNNPYCKGSHLHFAWENGFNEGFDSSQANPCFEENDLLDFLSYVKDNYYYNSSCWNNRETDKYISNRELLNLWIQSKSN